VPIGYQVVVRLEGDVVMAPSVEERRMLARMLLRASESSPIVAFGAADTHAHVLVVGDRAEAGEAARRVRIAWARSFPSRPRIERTSYFEVRDQWHLASCFGYVTRQAQGHGVPTDPTFDASSLVDYAGLRASSEACTIRAREHVPRSSARDLARMLGVEALEEWLRRPLAAAPLEGEALAILSESAAAAAGIGDLSGRGAEACAARLAAVHAVSRRVPRAELAAALMCDLRTVKRLGREEPSARLVAAVRGQASLRAILAAQAAGVEPPRPAMLAPVASARTTIMQRG
jgi:hypothetical protein